MIWEIIFVLGNKFLYLHKDIIGGMKIRHIFVTWHYTSYGIAYLKHILSAFYSSFSKNDSPNLDELTKPFLQEEMDSVFEQPDKNGFKFDKVYYLTAPQESFDSLSSRRKNRYDDETKDEAKYGIKDCIDALKEQEHIFRLNIEAELDFVKNRFPEKTEDFKRFLWRNIQYYPVAEQITWLKEISNFRNVYKDTDFTEVKLDVNNLRDEKSITDAVAQFVKANLPNTEETNYVINISLGSNETQVAWHILSQADCLPANVQFIKTYDDKENHGTTRFKPFTIQKTETRLIESLTSGIKLYPGTLSPKRALAEKLMSSYLDSGFSILILGARGIGKSRLVEKNRGSKVFISANCASFAGADDTMAESELFGYKKGAFTGAQGDKIGLIKQAENGILFLDEIHNLSKRVQAKLMTAFSTNEYNELSIRRVGATEVERVRNVHLVFASNNTIEELHDKLLPDFYDRIVQHVIMLPSLKETKEDREKDWETVWRELKFSDKPEPPKEEKLMSWLNTLELKGNFRDLQKIAMYYHIYQKFDEETRGMIQQKSPLAFAKTQYKAYVSYEPKSEELFSQGKTYREMVSVFHSKLEDWAIKNYGSRKQAAEKLDVTEKTLNNWRNNK